MKSRIITVIVLTVFLVAGIFGVVRRQTYTDIVSEDNYMDKLHVALLKEKNTISCCDALAVELPNAPIILKVKCVGEMEYVFKAGQQPVLVEEVYQGSELIGEEEIYIYSERWTVIMLSAPNSAERGYVNVMESGEEYLVFLTGKKVKVHGTDVVAYEVFSDLLLLPIFLYGEREHTTVEVDEYVSGTYVPYSKVKGNEMFTETEAGYKAWMKLKEMLFEKYV